MYIAIDREEDYLHCVANLARKNYNIDQFECINFFHDGRLCTLDYRCNNLKRDELGLVSLKMYVLKVFG